ncbi:MAG TPA: hypothetical protein VK826_01335, partial [Bacteroidia bacterium]|nr:hypothetical protein [Bacteroidia bacterium]
GMSVGIFLLNQKDATPYLIACYGAYGLCFLIGLALVLSRKHEPKLVESRPLLFVMFATGFFTQLASLTHQWSIRQNYFTLEEVLKDNKGSVGIYATAVALAEAILLFSASVAAVLMARLANEKQTQLSRNYTLRLSKLSIGVTALGVLFFAILPSEFYSWLLGKDFTGVHGIFLTLVPGVMLVSFGTVYGHYFSGSGKHHMNFFSGLFGLTLTMLFAHGLISRMGIAGAGWAGSIAYGGMALFIFASFMLVGNKNTGEWKELLPSRNDFAAIKNLFRKKTGDTE